MKTDPTLINKIGIKNLSDHKFITEGQKTKLSIIVFIWSALLFFVNLLYHVSDEFTILFFWSSILLMISIVIYQIFLLKNNTFVLLEIFFIYFFLHLVYQIGYYGLRGSDSYIDYNFLKTLLHNNHFTIDHATTVYINYQPIENTGNPGVSGWPMIHLFSNAFSIITKIDPLLIAKYLPSFISSIIILPIYLLSLVIFKEKKIALFTCLFFGFIPQFVNFEALFVRETYGLFILVLFIYILYISKRKNDFRYIGLAMLLVPVLVLSHHFTSLIILFFSFVYFVASIGVPYIYRLLIKKKTKFSGIIDIRIILIIIIISVISYWFYLKGSAWASTFIFGNINEIISPSNSGGYLNAIGLGSPIVTWTGRIIFYGFILFHVLFSLILLMKIIIIENFEKIDDISFTILFYLGIGYGFLSLYVLSSSITPDRLLTFGWIFGIFPLIGLLINIKKRMLKKILTVIFISFIIFNLYNIDSGYYTGKVVTDGRVVTEKEYLIAEKINFKNNLINNTYNNTYYGYNSVVAAIYDIQGIIQRKIGLDINQILNPLTAHYSYTLAVINEVPLLSARETLKIKSKEQYEMVNEILSYKDKINIDKFYDLGNIYVLKGV